MCYTESEKIILNTYNSLQSIKGTAKNTGYSWNKVVKTLSSNGYVLSETHAEILNKFENGRIIEQIAKEMSLNEKTVQAYIPRIRPVYNEELSENAIRIRKCRINKKNKSQGENYE